ncbi:replication factor C subunit [Aureococcus anophagefferens]|uniref:Replication factor C subunit n=1 Tax=Aureococcus anophagefferens TaxID=44056 RepID=A0ABR1FM47_AURAN
MLSPRIDPSTLVVHARELRTTRAERHRAWCAKADAESRLASLSAECQKLRRRDVARVKALRSTLRLLEIANEGKARCASLEDALRRKEHREQVLERALGAAEDGGLALRAREEETEKLDETRRAVALLSGDGPAPAAAPSPKYARRPPGRRRRRPRGGRLAGAPGPRGPRAAAADAARGVGFDAAGTPGRCGARPPARAPLRTPPSAASSPASVGTYSAYGRDPALHTIDDEGDDEPDEDAFGQVEFGVRARASPKPPTRRGPCPRGARGPRDLTY